MPERREPSLSTGDSDSRKQQRFLRGPRLRERPEEIKEPSFVFWVAAIALGLLLGGLGVKLISDWYELRQAAAVTQFVAAVNGGNEVDPAIRRIKIAITV